MALLGGFIGGGSGTNYGEGSQQKDDDMIDKSEEDLLNKVRGETEKSNWQS